MRCSTGPGMRGEGFAQSLGGFEEDDVIEQGEGLQRVVGNLPAGDAGLAGRAHRRC